LDARYPATERFSIDAVPFLAPWRQKNRNLLLPGKRRLPYGVASMVNKSLRCLLSFVPEVFNKKHWNLVKI